MLKAYAKKMTKKDIENFVNNKGIIATDEEIDIVFNHIKKYNEVFFDKPIYYIKMLKGKISDDAGPSKSNKGSKKDKDDDFDF